MPVSPRNFAVFVPVTSKKSGARLLARFVVWIPLMVISVPFPKYIFLVFQSSLVVTFRLSVEESETVPKVLISIAVAGSSLSPSPFTVKLNKSTVIFLYPIKVASDRVMGLPFVSINPIPSPTLPNTRPVQSILMPYFNFVARRNETVFSKVKLSAV